MLSHRCKMQVYVESLCCGVRFKKKVKFKARIKAIKHKKTKIIKGLKRI